MMNRKRKQLWRTAVHEAGHVVMIMAHDLAFNRVTIVPKDDYLGVVARRLTKRLAETLAGGASYLERSAAVEPLVRISFAGGVAVGIHCGKRGRWQGAAGDCSNVAGYMLHAYGCDGPSLQAHLRHLRQQTEVILSTPVARWQTKTIAKALLRRPTLRRKDVTAVLQAAAGCS